MDIEWATSLIGECECAGVPVFFKQTGAVLGKHLNLADSHGANHADPNFPKELQIQEFPKVLVTA